jgi:hypothetical protein
MRAKSVYTLKARLGSGLSFLWIGLESKVPHFFKIKYIMRNAFQIDFLLGIRSKQIRSPKPVNSISMIFLGARD